MKLEHKTLWEFIVFGVFGAGFVAGTINEMNVNGRTDYTLLFQTTSFWLLVVELLIIISYFMIKRSLKKRVSYIKDEIIVELKETLKHIVNNDFKKTIHDDVMKSLNSSNSREIKNCKSELKKTVDNRIDYYAEKRLVPLIYTEVSKEIEKAKKDIDEVKLQVAVLRELNGNRNAEQKLYNVDELRLEFEKFAQTLGKF